MYCVVLYCIIFLFIFLDKTPCRRPLHEELTIPQVVKNFAKYYGAQKLRHLLFCNVMKLSLVVYSTFLMQIVHFNKKG
jgi:hypothetical protein